MDQRINFCKIEVRYKHKRLFLSHQIIVCSAVGGPPFTFYWFHVPTAIYYCNW